MLFKKKNSSLPAKLCNPSDCLMWKIYRNVRSVMSSNDWDRSEQMECVLIEIVNVQARWSRFLILAIGLLFSALWFFFSWFYWLNNSNSLDHHNSTYPGEVNQVAKGKQTTISSLSSIQLEIRNSIFVTAGQSLEDASWRCEILVFTQKKGTWKNININFPLLWFSRLYSLRSRK